MIPVLGWQLDPVLIGTLVTVVVAYALAVGPLRARLGGPRQFPALPVAIFATGLVTVFLAEASPLHDLGEIYLFSAHMVQHLILSYVVPPLLIAGTPTWVLRPLLCNRFILPVARRLVHPAVALLVFSIGFSLWHIPTIYEGALQSSLVHHLEHIVFIGTALLMWWPVMSPLPELPRLDHGPRIVYLVLLPIGQFFVAAFLTFSPSAFYATYRAAPRITNLTAVADQQLGGIIMKMGGFIAFGIPLFRTFFAWYAADQRDAAARRGKLAPEPDRA
jgi:putative membrane protein